MGETANAVLFGGSEDGLGVTSPATDSHLPMERFALPTRAGRVIHRARRRSISGQF